MTDKPMTIGWRRSQYLSTASLVDQIMSHVANLGSNRHLWLRLIQWIERSRATRWAVRRSGSPSAACRFSWHTLPVGDILRRWASDCIATRTRLHCAVCCRREWAICTADGSPKDCRCTLRGCWCRSVSRWQRCCPPHRRVSWCWCCCLWSLSLLCTCTRRWMPGGLLLGLVRTTVSAITIARRSTRC